MMAIVLTLVSLVLCSGCAKEIASPNAPLGSRSPTVEASVIVEGTVFYFEGGGTRESQWPPGYQLVHSRWVYPLSRPDTGFAIYLSDPMLTSYVGERARAYGTLDSVAIRWQFNNQVSYATIIMLDSLQLIE